MGDGTGNPKPKGKEVRYMNTLYKLCFCVLLAATVNTVVKVSASESVGQLPYEYPTPVAVPVQPIKAEVLSSAVLVSYSDSQPLATAVIKPQHKLTPRVIPAPSALLQRWNTTATDATATWPDATDPTRTLPMALQEKFACIRYHESRNHVHSLEIYSGAAGWYQFTPYIWGYAVSQLRGLPASIAQATGDQQSRVAVWYYERNHGFFPEWDADASACHL